MIGDSHYETKFQFKLLLTDTQDLRIRKAFADGSSAYLKFSKTQLSMTIQLGQFLGFFYSIEN